MAACFSSREEKNKETGEFYGIAQDRLYSSYEEMAKAESAREDGIDFVSIVTPNATHYEVAKAFLEAGIHVACEKPLCFTIEQGEELEQIAKEKHLMFAVTYTYTGYAMVKLAKELVEAGEIGKVVNVNAEYLQDWLIDEIGGGNQTTTKSFCLEERIPANRHFQLCGRYRNPYRRYGCLYHGHASEKSGGSAG